MLCIEVTFNKYLLWVCGVIIFDNTEVITALGFCMQNVVDGFVVPTYMLNFAHTVWLNGD